MLLFFLTSIIENEQLLLFSPFFPLAKGIISRLQDTKSFPKHHSYCFPRQQILYGQRHIRSGKREFWTPLQNTALLKDLQELYFNLLLTCLRVYLFGGGGERADIGFLNIQWSRYIFPPNICWPNPALCCWPRLIINLIILLLTGCWGCHRFNLHRKTINSAGQRAFNIKKITTTSWVCSSFTNFFPLQLFCNFQGGSFWWPRGFGKNFNKSSEELCWQLVLGSLDHPMERVIGLTTGDQIGTKAPQPRLAGH